MSQKSRQLQNKAAKNDLALRQYRIDPLDTFMVPVRFGARRELGSIPMGQGREVRVYLDTNAEEGNRIAMLAQMHKAIFRPKPLLDRAVHHKVFGPGTVVAEDAGTLTVRFNDRERKVKSDPQFWITPAKAAPIADSSVEPASANRLQDAA